MSFSNKGIAFSNPSTYTKRNLVTHTEAKEILKEMGIKTSREYYKISLEVKKKLGLPTAPHNIYKGKGWVSWGDFFGREDILFVKIDEAKEIVKRMKIRTSLEYNNLPLEKKKSLGLPSAPYKIYKDKGWTCWRDFLARNENLDLRFVTLEEAKKIVKQMKVRTSMAYYTLTFETRRRVGLPSNPEQYYRDKGWTCWRDFLGREALRFATLKEAKTIVKKMGIRTSMAYHALTLEERKEVGLPSNPGKIYKDKGWESWGDFLGKKD